MVGRGEIDVGMGLLRSHTRLTFTRLLRVYLCLGKEETSSTHVLGYSLWREASINPTYG